MVIRKKHPDKVIEKAIRNAEKQGWRYKEAGASAHAWGRLLCPLHEREGCSFSIWSTPRSTTNHARQIIQRIKLCKHINDKEDVT